MPPGPRNRCLAGFKLFFTMVLLHQIFASLRQGKLLAETITDFWSPHEPIHERARNALPTYGALAIGPLLGSLRLVPMLTKEQRDRLPLILETIGPSIIPALVRDLRDPHAARSCHRRCRSRPAPCLESSACTGHARSRPQRDGAAKRGRSTWGPRQPAARIGPVQSRPRSGPRREGRMDLAFLRGAEATRAVPESRPGRAGRGDASVGPGRRLVVGADPGCHGTGPDWAVRCGGGPAIDRVIGGAGRNGSLPGGRPHLARSAGNRRLRWPHWSKC